MKMETVVYESDGPNGGRSGITLTQIVSWANEERAEAAADGDRVRRPALALAHGYARLLRIALLQWPVTAAGVLQKRKPHSPGEAGKGSQILLLQKLVKDMAKDGMGKFGESTAVTVSPIGFGNSFKNAYSDSSNSTIRATLLQLMERYQNMRPIWEDGVSSDEPRYANFGCPYDDINMRQTEECNAWKAFVFRYLFPWVLILAILGNTLTLTVYRSRYLKSAASVLLLAVKAQANLAFACSLTMEMLHYFIPDDTVFQDVYWKSLPYTLFLANYFDSLAVWCTVVITLETYICVSFPLSFRRWSKRRTIYIVIVCLMLASGLLHVAYPITWYTDTLPSCPASHRYRILIRDGPFYHDYERAYFFLHALAVISFPVLLMAVFSILIGYHFSRKAIGQRFSERRRCVLRITFTTTILSLVLQMPGLVVFTSAAVRGSNLEENLSFCTINVVTNFLTILNSAAPFLVYLCLNDTFRRLLFVQLGSRCTCESVCRNSYETHLQRVPIRELTEPEPSQCAPPAESNSQMFPLHGANRKVKMESEEGKNCVNGKENTGNMSPLLNAITTTKITPTVKVVIEEVL